MSSHEYDLVILGGGAAAFAAITEASDRDLSTAMVNAGLPLGGTCVNVGCIPSKHLLAVAETAHAPRANPFSAVEYGPEPIVNWPTAIDEMDRLVAALRERNYVGVADHHDTDIYEGYGRFADERTIEVVDGVDEGTQLRGRTILVATGSAPRIAPIDGIEDVPLETSESILERPTLPESIVLIGGGYVGCEWGQVLSRVGVDVTILQRSSHVLSGLWPELGRDLQAHLRAEGLRVITDATPTEVRSTSDGGVRVEASGAGGTREFTANDLFVATGVRPNTRGLGLESVGVETDESGAIVVDRQFRTATETVFAAGDCIGDPMLRPSPRRRGITR